MSLLARRLAGVSTAAVLTAALAVPAQAQFASASYSASQSIADVAGLFCTTMTMAHNSTGYWATSGGCAGRDLAHYDNAGNFVAAYSNGQDFRSLFTDAAGNFYSRNFSDNTVYKMSPTNVFTPFASLAGGMDAQSSVVFNGAGSEFIAMSGGTVQRWDLSGNSLGSVSLSGFGGCENSYPQNRGVAAAGSYYLTIDGCGGDETLSAWDAGGNRTDTAVLLGSGNSFDTNFSLSYANGMVWLDTQNGGTWHGYDVGLGSPVDNGVAPEPASLALLGTGLVGLAGFAARRRK